MEIFFLSCWNADHKKPDKGEENDETKKNKNVDYDVDDYDDYEQQKNVFILRQTHKFVSRGLYYILNVRYSSSRFGLQFLFVRVL